MYVPEENFTKVPEENEGALRMTALEVAYV